MASHRKPRLRVKRWLILTVCRPLIYVRSSPEWNRLYQYSRGAPLSTPKKFIGSVESPCEPKEIVPKCSPGTKNNFSAAGLVITSSKSWNVRLEPKPNEFT